MSFQNIKYLSRVVSAVVIEPNDDKFVAIKAYRISNNLKDLKSYF